MAVHVFLLTPLGPRTASRPRLEIDWRLGFSPWPGEVWLRDCRIAWRGGEARLDDLDLRFDLAELALRRFHATEVRGRGLELVVERRRREGAAGGSEPGTRTPGTRGPRPGRGQPWTIELDDVAVDEVRRIDVGGQAFTAERGRLEASFATTVRGPLAVPRLELEMEGTSAAETVGRLERLRLTAALGPFLPRLHRGDAWLAFLDARLELEAPEADLGWLDHYFRGAPITLRGHGRLAADLRVERGRLGDGSRVEVPSAEVEVVYLDAHGRGQGGLEVEVEGGAANLELLLDGFEIARGGDARAHIRGRGLKLSASTQVLDLSRRAPPIVAELVIPDSEVPDFTVYNAYLGQASPIVLDAGSGRIVGRLGLDSGAGTASGELTLSGRGVGAAMGGVRLDGDLELRVRLGQGDLLSRRFPIGGSRLALDGVVVAGGGVRERDWWAQLELTGGEARLGVPLELAADVSARLRDTSPLVPLLADRHAAARWLGRLVTVADVRGRGRLELDGGSLVVRDLEVRGSRDLEVLGQLRVAERRDALFFCALGRLSVTVEVDQGRRFWTPLGSRRWYESRLPLFWQRFEVPGG